MKVLWDVKSGDLTWEFGETIKETYPHLFSVSQSQEQKFLLLGRT